MEKNKNEIKNIYINKINVEKNNSIKNNNYMSDIFNPFENIEFCETFITHVFNLLHKSDFNDSEGLHADIFDKILYVMWFAPYRRDIFARCITEIATHIKTIYYHTDLSVLLWGYRHHLIIFPSKQFVVYMSNNNRVEWKIQYHLGEFGLQVKPIVFTRIVEKLLAVSCVKRFHGYVYKSHKIAPTMICAVCSDFCNGRRVFVVKIKTKNLNSGNFICYRCADFANYFTNTLNRDIHREYWLHVEQITNVLPTCITLYNILYGHN